MVPHIYFSFNFKEAVSRDFLHFLVHESNPSGPLMNILKLFCEKIRFREDIRKKRDSAHVLRQKLYMEPDQPVLN